MSLSCGVEATEGRVRAPLGVDLGAELEPGSAKRRHIRPDRAEHVGLVLDLGRGNPQGRHSAGSPRIPRA